MARTVKEPALQDNWNWFSPVFVGRPAANNRNRPHSPGNEASDCCPFFETTILAPEVPARAGQVNFAACTVVPLVSTRRAVYLYSHVGPGHGL